MKNTFTKNLLLLVVLGGVVSCSRMQPVHNSAYTIPDYGTNLSSMEVRDSILHVTQRREWSCRDEAPGKLSCRIQQGSYNAAIQILYDQNSFSIQNISTNLKNEDGEVHKRYNKWVKILDKEIRFDIRKKARAKI